MRNGFLRSAAGLLATLPFIIASCMKSDVEVPDFNKQLTSDIQAIDNYLASKNLIATEDISGLRYIIHRDTTGSSPSIDSCVTANYQGLLLSNELEFDKGAGISFPLRDVIDGWKIAIPLLNEGDSATLYVPSGYAYGYYGYPPKIPANANMIFHVGVKKVGRTYKSSDRSCN